MSFSVKFEKNWSHPEDPAGDNVRHYPSGIVIELPDDLAAAAIFEGAAGPASGQITPDVQAYIDAYAAYVHDLDNGASLEQAEANMAAALAAANAAEASEQGQDGDDGEPPGSGNAGSEGDSGLAVDPVDPETGEVKPATAPARGRGRRATT